MYPSVVTYPLLFYWLQLQQNPDLLWLLVLFLSLFQRTWQVFLLIFLYLYQRHQFVVFSFFLHLSLFLLFYFFFDLSFSSFAFSSFAFSSFNFSSIPSFLSCSSLSLVRTQVRLARKSTSV